LIDFYQNTSLMCRHETLYHDDRTGYVVRCCECEKIQVGFNNVVITFNVEEFSSFRSWLLRIKNECQPGQNDKLRSIVIPTPCDGMKLLLSLRELNEFNIMLETADSELRSLELIKLFET
jgi:hypothetical protein